MSFLVLSIKLLQLQYESIQAFSSLLSILLSCCLYYRLLNQCNFDYYFYSPSINILYIIETQMMSLIHIFIHVSTVDELSKLSLD